MQTVPCAHVVDSVLLVVPPCVLDLKSSQPVQRELEVAEPKPEVRQRKDEQICPANHQTRRADADSEKQGHCTHSTYLVHHHTTAVLASSRQNFASVGLAVAGLGRFGGAGCRAEVVQARTVDEAKTVLR